MFEQWASEQYASTAAWFDDTDVFEDHQILLHTEESRQAVPVLQGLLQGDAEPAAAAASLAGICGSRVAAGRSGDIMAPQGVWKVFCGAVDHFGGDARLRDRLVALLLHLSEIDVLDGAGAPVRSRMNQDTFWRQLPGYSLAFRDEMTGLPPMANLVYDDQREVWSRRFHNGNAFQAQWIAQVGLSGPRREYESALNIAQWHLREALETIIEPSPVGVLRVEIYVPGVTPWIFIAGEALFQLCKANVRDDGTPAFQPPFWSDGVEGYGYTGREGFNLERWAHWKDKLKRVPHLQGIKLEVSEIATSAAARMEDIEKEAEVAVLVE